MSNFAPLACVRLLELCSKDALSDEESRQLNRLQEVLAVADVVVVPAGVRGMSEWIGLTVVVGLEDRSGCTDYWQSMLFTRSKAMDLSREGRCWNWASRKVKDLCELLSRYLISTKSYEIVPTCHTLSRI